MEDNSKKIRTLSIMIIILLLVVVGLLIYILYDKKKGQNIPVDNTSQETEVVDDTDAKTKIVESAEKILNDKNLYQPLVVFGTEKEDFYKGNMKDLPNQTKLQLAFLHYGNGELFETTSDNVLKYYQSVFGKDYNIEFEDVKDFSSMGIDSKINDNDAILKYNSQTKKYEESDEVGGHGFSLLLGDLIKSKLVDYKEENGVYKLTYKQLFCTNCSVSGEGYGDDRDNFLIFVNIKNEEVFRLQPPFAPSDIEKGAIDFDEPENQKKINQTIENAKNTEFDKVTDKLYNVTYTFEKEEDHLVLKSINY